MELGDLLMSEQINKNIDRRGFLKASAAAGASLLMTSQLTAQEPPKKSDDLQIALIGAGAQGQELMNACLRIPGIRFKAVCDIWTAYNQKRAVRLLQKYGHDVTGYVDYRDLLAKERGLDGVIIATPDFWHARQTVDCLEAGLHVYCEKEMSNTLEGARRMVAAARRTGKLLQIGHQRRSNPRYIHCYEKIIKEAKILGQITTINAQWNRAVQPDLGWPKRYAIPPSILRRYGFESMHQFRNWRWFKDLGGGAIIDLGSHQIDIFNWFLEAKPKTVVASGGTDYYDKSTHEWYDTVQALYEYDTRQGTVRAFYQTITTNSSQGYYENFMGDQGSLYISESASKGGIYREPTAPDWRKWIDLKYLTAPKEEPKQLEAAVVLDVRETIAPPSHGIPVDFNDLYHKPHLENFFDAIRGKATLHCPPDVGFESAVTVLKVNEAVATGRKLTYDPKEFVA